MSTISRFPICIHPVLGEIFLDERFRKIIDMPEMQSLAYKSQLGVTSLSTEFPGAKHTRFMHSIGVCEITDRLVDICKNKFPLITITQKDRDIVKLAALLHDVGHYAFSHSVEYIADTSHEENTYRIIARMKPRIDDIFGDGTSDEVINILKDNANIKSQGENITNMPETLDFKYILRGLLAGTIDCDRMEYLATDEKMTYGTSQNMFGLFNYITIILFNQIPTVGFEKAAVPMIDKFLTTRFNMYCDVYYNTVTVFKEIAMDLFLKRKSYQFSDVEDYTEEKYITELNEALHSEDSTLRRYARYILFGEKEGLLFKKFEKEEEFNYFVKLINSFSNGAINVYTAQRKVTVYDPKKNNVYIKDDDGVVKDITQVSTRVKEISAKFFYVMVDIESIHERENVEKIMCIYEESNSHVIAEICEKLKKSVANLFLNNLVEIEKKFVIDSSIENKIEFCIQKIQEIKDLKILKINTIQNRDVYFDTNVLIPNSVAIRLRYNSKEDESNYYIKINAIDGTSITKRYEFIYPSIIGINEFEVLAKERINMFGGNIEELKFTKGISIVTNRHLILTELKGSTIEIALDTSSYELNGVIYDNDFMIECELKSGEDLALWHITNCLRKLGFSETDQSKLFRARKSIKNN